MNRSTIIGLLLFVPGIVLLLDSFQVIEVAPRTSSDLVTIARMIVAAVMVVFGVMLILGLVPTKITGKGIEVIFSRETKAFFSREEKPLASLASIEKAELDPEDKAQKEAYASNLRLPTRGAPPFRVLTEKSISETGLWPGADPNIPMYSLGKDYRILGWNKAFSLAFDRSMEGLRGQFVTEWVYHLANYQNVLRHGESAFADRNNLPRIDVEKIRFVSKRYNGISATKRAYQIPDDEGQCAGWLVILDLRFDDDKAHSRFLSELIQLQRMELIWSEYSIVYDRVLTNTKIYQELIAEMIEGPDGGRLIRDGTTVLDLGAGTGNISVILAESSKNRRILALDDNRMMLNVLKWKCENQLTDDPTKPGVTVIKQDILSLYGIDDNYFDYVIANNVLYSLGSREAIQNCLREAYRVLKPNGEIRLSGPKKDTDINRLFKRIEADLKAADRLEELKNDFQKVEEINKKRLEPFLHQYDLEDMKKMTLEAGFSKIIYESKQAYGGEAMIVFAAK